MRFSSARGRVLETAILAEKLRRSIIRYKGRENACASPLYATNSTTIRSDIRFSPSTIRRRPEKEGGKGGGEREKKNVGRARKICLRSLQPFLFLSFSIGPIIKEEFTIYEYVRYVPLGSSLERTMTTEETVFFIDVPLWKSKKGKEERRKEEKEVKGQKWRKKRVIKINEQPRSLYPPRKRIFSSNFSASAVAGVRAEINAKRVPFYALDHKNDFYSGPLNEFDQVVPRLTK